MSDDLQKSYGQQADPKESGLQAHTKIFLLHKQDKGGKNKPKTFKKALSILLAVLMLLSSLSVSTWAVVFDNSLVKGLASLYDGDEARAREALEALYEAGIIDKNGNLVALNVREDGKKVELDDVAQRIANGESVGALTINGHDATPEQLLQIKQVKSLLEIIKLMDNDVKITDEHVASLQALLEGILDGSIDLNDAIEQGEMQVKASRKAPRRASGNYSDTGSTGWPLLKRKFWGSPGMR